MATKVQPNTNGNSSTNLLGASLKVPMALLANKSSNNLNLPIEGSKTNLLLRLEEDRPGVIVRNTNFEELNRLLKPSLPQHPNETHVLNKQRLDEFGQHHTFRDHHQTKDTSRVAKLRTHCQHKMEKLYQETLRARRMILRVFARTQTITPDSIQRLEALKENLYATLQEAAELEVAESFYISSTTLPPLLEFDVPAWLLFLNTAQRGAEEKKQMEAALRAVLKQHVLSDLPLPMTVAPIIDPAASGPLANPFQRLAAKVGRSITPRTPRNVTPRQELTMDEQILQWITAYRPQNDPRMQKRELIVSNQASHLLLSTSFNLCQDDPVPSSRSDADGSSMVPPGTARRRPNGSIALPPQVYQRSSHYAVHPSIVSAGAPPAPPVPPLSENTSKYLAALLASTISTSTSTGPTSPVRHNKPLVSPKGSHSRPHAAQIPGVVPDFVFGGESMDTNRDSSRSGGQPPQTARKVVVDDSSIWLQEKGEFGQDAEDLAAWDSSKDGDTSRTSTSTKGGKRTKKNTPSTSGASGCKVQQKASPAKPTPAVKQSSPNTVNVNISASSSASATKKPIIFSNPTKEQAAIPRPGAAFQPLKPKAIGIPSFWGTDYSNEAAAAMESVRATPHRGNSIFSWVRGRMRKSQSVVEIDPDSGRMRASSFAPPSAS